MDLFLFFISSFHPFNTSIDNQSHATNLQVILNNIKQYVASPDLIVPLFSFRRELCVFQSGLVPPGAHWQGCGASGDQQIIYLLLLLGCSEVPPLFWFAVGAVSPGSSGTY